ncbi:MAG: hypothetical protein E7K64_01020 [Clostridia bacterium]|nr:hypothetical protein [Clostridiales bacterium]MDU7504614.1 hypothetical protein [Clostridia bacterium]
MEGITQRIRRGGEAMKFTKMVEDKGKYFLNKLAGESKKTLETHLWTAAP